MEFQSWIQKLLEDPQITDICINGIHIAYCDRGGGMERLQEYPPQEDSETKWTEADLKN